MLDLKDKLNLLWKFLFLAVFTYGVICVTCCKNSCQSSCTKNNTESSQCCKKSNTQVEKKRCGANCIKPCCSK